MHGWLERTASGFKKDRYITGNYEVVAAVPIEVDEKAVLAALIQTDALKGTLVV